ncbi:MAG: NAD-dependent epimerase/dehydratase family protein [Roseiflexaceae bacterium]|nr:NAD-dependent epimerase/dehydratase family protein [Roseiflexaceae bacterium]
MKVLIIGGTGLISSAITRTCLERGVDVTLYNRGQSPVRFNAGATILTGDRYNYPAFIQQIASLGSFDCVIDMLTFTPDHAQSAVEAFQGRTGQYIFCSTVDVYSKPASRYPLREIEPRKGNNEYGRNKILCEDIFAAAHQQGKLSVTTIRPAMSYGEGKGIVDFSGWSTRIFDRLLKGKPILVHGDGSALWVACLADLSGHRRYGYRDRAG